MILHLKNLCSLRFKSKITILSFDLLQKISLVEIPHFLCIRYAVLNALNQLVYLTSKLKNETDHFTGKLGNTNAF